MRWYDMNYKMFKVRCKKIRMLFENIFQPNIAIMARKCTSLYWEAAKQDFSTTAKIASLPLQGVSYLFVPQIYISVSQNVQTGKLMLETSFSG